VNNKMESLHMQYDFKLNERTSLIPKLDMARGNPITTAVSPDFTFSSGNVNFFGPVDPWQNQAGYGSRYQTEIEVNSNITPNSNLTGGAGYQYNTVYSTNVFGNPGLQTSANPADTVSSYGRATTFAYFQYSGQLKTVGFTVGSRYEVTPFGQAFVPRFGLTYVKNNFNAKLLYGRAFRVPLLWQAYSRQFAFRPDLKPLQPEFSNSYELELGYKISPFIKVSTNFFYIHINTPIFYLGSNNSYQNYGLINSLGAESELQLKYRNLGGFINLSYATPGSNTSREFTNESRTAFLALPPFKANIGTNYTFHNITVSSTITYLGTRYGQSKNSAISSLPSNIIYATTSYPSLLMVNAQLVYHISKNFQINFLGNNIFNANYLAIQPYYGSHAPLPAFSRQINIGVRLKI